MLYLFRQQGETSGMFTKFLEMCILIGSCAGTGAGYWSVVLEIQHRQWEHMVYSIYLVPLPPGYEWHMTLFFRGIGCFVGLVGGYFIQQRLPKPPTPEAIPATPEQGEGVWPPAPRT